MISEFKQPQVKKGDVNSGRIADESWNGDDGLKNSKPAEDISIFFFNVLLPRDRSEWTECPGSIYVEVFESFSNAMVSIFKRAPTCLDSPAPLQLDTSPLEHRSSPLGLVLGNP